MAPKTSWHRHGTKLRRCHPMYWLRIRPLRYVARRKYDRGCCGPHASWLLPLTTASAAALADDMRALAKKLSGFFSRRKLGRHGWAALVGGLRGGKPSLFSLPNFPLDCPFLLSTALSVLVISLVHHYARAALFLSYYAFVCEIHL